MHKRDFLSLSDVTPAELDSLLDLAAEVKSRPEAYSRALSGRAGVLIFEKPSLRTRVTFEIGLVQLGAQTIYLAPGDIALGRREPAPDIARNLERWVDVLIVRTFGQWVLEEMARAAKIPVVNALSDLLHPCQTVADLLTLRERWGTLAGRKIAYIGDGNNVAHSLIQGAAKTGLHLKLATPRGYEPSPAILDQAAADARATGSDIRVVLDPEEAATGADAVYTDVWTSMGQEEQTEQRRKDFVRYRVDAHLMSLARPGAVFLHCLPAHRGEEVAAEVLDGPQSVALDQAENRLPAHKAILLAVLCGREPRRRAEVRR
ncbi:MAG: ornithine carbamoyltransferase [Acidobacteriota bacterium]|nr:ornithine carbamoyltransferase [Acidobacteriota bacterium]